ncbi:hypothetical protein ACJJTC_009330 [Scirpophaga incertulas]
MFFRHIVLLLVSMCYLVIINEIHALKDGDDGVCSGKIRYVRDVLMSFKFLTSRKTKRVYYTRYTNKWCGRKKCVVRATKTQPYVAMVNVQMCCSGWQYRSDIDACAPLCSTGCAGGRCVAPERCACDAPAFLDEHNNTCLFPVCQPPCFNADCIVNTCSCHQQYRPYNATHCHNCDQGYTVNDTFQCIPKCDEHCFNATCTAPNTCTCLPGYKRRDHHTCVPECDRCVNSECTAPDTCSCLTGYTPLNSTYCTPICGDCGRGVCIAPGVCKCDEGFSIQNGTCQPHCNNSCVNGYCSGPNECTCNDGYTKNETKRYECFKPCEKPCEGICDIHGECFCEEERRDLPTIQKTHACKKRKCYHTEHGKVITRRIKVCCTGYAFSEGKCIPLTPICDPPCHNAQCTSKNNCTCNDLLTPLNNTHCGPRCDLGFYNDPSDLSLSCISQCKQPCVNATCTDFDTCACNDGYKFAPGSKYQCEPECKTCKNGTCIAPNTCSCLPGYKDKNDGNCRPVCDEDCSNGTCTAPNVCTCHPNYQLYSSNKFLCNPICVNECTNASCVAPNTCICKNGFEPVNEWSCRPKCDSCENGHCVAPNECKCNKGYERDSSGKCEPFCLNKCQNATCVAPDTCVCNTDFVSTAHEWVCRPKCDICEHGECVAPNKCRCNEGYAKNDSDICSPVCTDKCEHGFCSEPGVCQCNTGYMLDEVLKQCIPICEEKCVNSTCVSPNKCECLNGYISKSESTCRPFCSSCDNGECAAPEVCQCHDGYTRMNETCNPILVLNCAECEGRCNGSVCACANGTVCETMEQAGVASTPTLAGLQLTWMLGTGVGVLLIVIIVVIIHHTWRKRNVFEQKTAGAADYAHGSVVYAAPGTLLSRDTTLGQCEEDSAEDYVERL